MLQGVVTYMSCVEAFATGIKIESIKALLGIKTSELLKINNQDCNLTADPWKSSDQEPQKGPIK